MIAKNNLIMRNSLSQTCHACVVSTVQDVSANLSSGDLESGGPSLPRPFSSLLLGSSSVGISSTHGPSLPCQSSHLSLPDPSNTSYYSHQSSRSSLLKATSGVMSNYGSIYACQSYTMMVCGGLKEMEHTFSDLKLY